MWLSSPWSPHCKTCGLWFWQNGFSVNYWLTYKLRLTNFLLQRVNIGATFSSYLEILINFPQGSILGAILFNFFINNFVFVKKTKVSNLADNTTIYSCSLNYEEAHRKLSDGIHIVPNWFRINSMVDKFHIIFLGSSINNNQIIFDNSIIFIVENKHIKTIKK